MADEERARRWIARLLERARRWIARLLARLSHPRWRHEIEEDLLDEARRQREAGASRFATRLRLVRALTVEGLASRWHAARAKTGEAKSHDSRRGGGMGMLMGDVRFALRGLRRAPVFTAVALLTLGAGIGLTLAIFTVVNAVLVRPLDYPDPDRLVLLQGQPGARFGVSMPHHELFRDESELLTGAAAWQGWGPVAQEPGGSPTRLAGASVSASFFSLVGVGPAAGRLFAPEDGRPGHEPVVVISHDFWVARYGADPELLGRSIELDGSPHRVVGVAPEDFRDPVAGSIGFSPRALWRADPPSFAETPPGNVSFWSVGRVRPDVPVDAVSAEMRRLLVEAYPGDEIEEWTREFRAITVQAALVEEVQPTLLVLLATAGFVLLIASANLANLLLSRATVRRGELAVRSSLGAARGRLVRQLVTESVVLSLVGSLLGLALARATVPLLVRMAGPALPRSAEVGFDGVVLLAALGTGLATALLFGVGPAFRATRPGALGRAGGSARGRAGRGARLRNGLVVAETALAMVLLTGAGLLTTTLLQLQSVEVGFDPDGVWTVGLGLGEERFPTPDLQTDALRRIEEALAALPGVTAVGGITDAPMSGAVNSTRVARLDDTDEAAAARRNVLVRAVTPGYFDAVDIATVRGRSLPDAPDGEIAVVNEDFVGDFFPGEDPLGRIVRVRGVERTIVGVVANVREFDLTSPSMDPVLYEPYAQTRAPWMRSGVTLTVRTPDASPGGGDRLRATTLAAEPTVLVGTVRPMRALVDAQLRVPRFRATLVLLFGGLAVLLAAVGLGGVVAYGVSQRLPEFGVRMALGARSVDVRGMMLRETAVIVLLGVLIGTGGSLLVARVLSSFLFGIDAQDPRILAGAATMLLAVGLLSGWWPARRAARIDPASTLRSG